MIVLKADRFLISHDQESGCICYGHAAEKTANRSRLRYTAPGRRRPACGS